jgi:hypothetical protein
LKGATESRWAGLGLLSGSSISDMIVTALSLFCSAYSTSNRASFKLLRKELPDLTDEDVEWLCGLTEAAEAWEPVAVKSPGNFVTPTVRARPSKRHKGGSGTASTRALESAGGASPQTNSLDAIGPGRKRRPVTLSHPSKQVI